MDKTQLTLKSRQMCVSFQCPLPAIVTNAQLSQDMIKHEDFYSLQNFTVRNCWIYQILIIPDLGSSFHLRDANSFRKHMFAVNILRPSAVSRPTSSSGVELVRQPWKQVKRLKEWKLRMDQT